MRVISLKLDTDKERDRKINDFLAFSKNAGISHMEALRQAVERVAEPQRASHSLLEQVGKSFKADSNM